MLPDARQLLAAYPHIAHCEPCATYAGRHHRLPVAELLAATLGHHDSCHRFDPIRTALHLTAQF